MPARLSDRIQAKKARFSSDLFEAPLMDGSCNIIWEYLG